MVIVLLSWLQSFPYTSVATAAHWTVPGVHAALRQGQTGENRDWDFSRGENNFISEHHLTAEGPDWLQVCTLLHEKDKGVHLAKDKQGHSTKRVGHYN